MSAQLAIQDEADVVLTHAQGVEKRLFAKYHGDDFAICFEVRNSAGFSANRACDAMGIGLWPSRGCHLHGFEIKVSRADWLRELKEPAKAEAFATYCDFWYVAAGARDIVRPDELPEGWGLLVPRGERLEEIVKATKREALPMPRGMLAAFVKRASQQAPVVGALKDARERGRAEGVVIGQRAALKTVAGEDMGTAYKALRASVDKFRAETGINVEYTFDAPAIAAALDLVKEQNARSHAAIRLRRAADDITHDAAALRLRADELTKATP